MSGQETQNQCKKADTDSPQLYSLPQKMPFPPQFVQLLCSKIAARYCKVDGSLLLAETQSHKIIIPQVGSILTNLEIHVAATVDEGVVGLAFHHAVLQGVVLIKL